MLPNTHGSWVSMATMGGRGLDGSDSSEVPTGVKMAGIRVYYTSVTGSREVRELCHEITASCSFCVLKPWSKSFKTDLYCPMPLDVLILEFFF